MAKYLTEFGTYAEYSGATLSLPNVSLIKNTGEVYYKNVFAGDTLGDVLMYDIANDKLVSSIGGNWSAEAFPIASYTPIAVNVYPASQTPDGKNRYMAIRWASVLYSTGQPNVSSASEQIGATFNWGPDDFNPSTDTNAFNGRANQDVAEALIPGTSGTTQEYYPAFYACSIFAPPGTQAGDWYLPSAKELSLYASNYSTIDNIITAIKTAAGSSYINTVSSSQYTSTSVLNLNTKVYGYHSGQIKNNFLKTYGERCRAMISI